ncbi:MAG: hypothetical protein ACI9U2_001737 [Bradymonadia bacterium]|jgi:hypothetical protein
MNHTHFAWGLLISIAPALGLIGCDDDTIRPIERLDTGVEFDFDLPPQDQYIPPDMSNRGAFGDLCSDGTECASGHCLERPGGGRVCSDRCGAGDCPEGWECQFVANESVDQGFYCVADQPDLCRPCMLDVECDDNDDLCILVGVRTFCGEACEGEGDCPEGYECASIERGDQTVLQCVPSSGECLPCEDADGDGYGTGDGCLGFDCDDDDPTSYAEAPELCDGVDNNCNSDIDEREALGEDPPEEIVCSDVGVCAGSFVACLGGAWACNYPNTYEEGAETLCDGLDNDCDGTPDDDLDLTSDAANCRFCGNACDFDNAAGLCAESNCLLGDCSPGFFNVDSNDGNGCEYGCNVTRDGVEACDEVDNDCDGGTDEDFDQQVDVNHCGQCNRVCAFQNAVPGCAAGECSIASCEPGWTDLNAMTADGCEFECGLTNDGVEACDTLDNDCDGLTDETFDLQNSLAHCGQCNRACGFDNAMPLCVEGDCALGMCAGGFVNANGDPADGCEYACVPTRDGVEACDQIDNDCDGRTDEDFLNIEETCDGLDNDCDGNIDETFDLQTDAENCGVCGNGCDLADAIGRCGNGQCAVAECDGGFVDLDGLAENGCEYACQLTNGGLEACDNIDNDCDGLLDEDAPVDADPLNCGACGQQCAFINAQGACEDSACVLNECDEGFVDLDGDPANGCEYACVFQQAGDLPDVGNIDADCDGVDGDIERAIFVRGGGDDAQDGATPQTAVSTFQRAIALADGNRDQILVQAGVYRVNAAVALRGGVGIFSGYSADFRVRGGNRALIESTAIHGVDAVNLDAPVLLSRVDIAVTNRGDAGQETVGLWVDASANHLTIRQSDIRAGRGGGGVDGSGGGQGGAGSRGNNGSGSTGGGGGNTGGGRGGNGRNRSSGLPGAAGAANGSPGGGAGGPGNGQNLGCNDGDPRAGGNGGGGRTGNTGGQGGGGNATGGFAGNGRFLPSIGAAGQRGGTGGGAGGGGAGGGENCRVFGGCVYCGTGRGAGGGGGGGQGGAGGLFGTGGGASISVLLRNSTLTIEDVNIATIGGGTGGRGGAGGGGGPGGGAGSGAGGNSEEGSGGDGGQGGQGGRGGCGGGGGGGPSVGVWGVAGATLVQRGDITFEVAGGGAGGGGCGQAGGRGGVAGISENTRSVALQ